MGAIPMECRRKRWPAQTVHLDVCDAPTARFDQFALSALTCPFGTSHTPHIGVCATRKPQLR